MRRSAGRWWWSWWGDSGVIVRSVPARPALLTSHWSQHFSWVRSREHNTWDSYSRHCQWWLLEYCYTLHVFPAGILSCVQSEYQDSYSVSPTLWREATTLCTFSTTQQPEMPEVPGGNVNSWCWSCTQQLCLRYLQLLVLVYIYQKRNLTVSQVFQKNVKNHPDKVCMYFEDESWTFKQVISIRKVLTVLTLVFSSWMSTAINLLTFYSPLGSSTGTAWLSSWRISLSTWGCGWAAPR